MMGDVPDMVKQKNGGLARSIAFPLFSVSKSHRYAFNAFMLSYIAFVRPWNVAATANCAIIRPAVRCRAIRTLHDARYNDRLRCHRSSISPIRLSDGQLGWVRAPHPHSTFLALSALVPDSPSHNEVLTKCAAMSPLSRERTPTPISVKTRKL